MKYFGCFSSKREFKETPMSALQLHLLLGGATSWPEEKLVLTHPSCPIDIAEQYAESTSWYKRLVAMCSQAHWKHFKDRALVDRKSTVRAAMYRRAMFEAASDTEFNSLLQRAKADERCKNYFRWTEEV